MRVQLVAGCSLASKAVGKAVHPDVGNPNKLAHVFQEKHGLGGLAEKLGGQEEAMGAIVKAASCMRGARVVTAGRAVDVGTDTSRQSGPQFACRSPPVRGDARRRRRCAAEARHPRASCRQSSVPAGCDRGPRPCRCARVGGLPTTIEPAGVGRDGSVLGPAEAVDASGNVSSSGSDYPDFVVAALDGVEQLAARLLGAEPPLSDDDE